MGPAGQRRDSGQLGWLLRAAASGHESAHGQDVHGHGPYEGGQS